MGGFMGNFMDDFYSSAAQFSRRPCYLQHDITRRQDIN
jgi:hypothetical protein